MGNCASSRTKWHNINSLKDDLWLAEAAISFAEKELTVLRREVIIFKEELQSKEHEVSRLQNSLKSLQESNGALDAEKGKHVLETEHTKEELAACTKVLKSKHDDITVLEGRLTALNAENDELVLEKRNCVVEFEQTKQELVTCKEDSQSHREAFTALEGSLATVQAKHDALELEKSGRISELEQRLTVARTEKDELDAEKCERIGELEGEVRARDRKLTAQLKVNRQTMDAKDEAERLLAEAAKEIRALPSTIMALSEILEANPRQSLTPDAGSRPQFLLRLPTGSSTTTSETKAKNPILLDVMRAKVALAKEIWMAGWVGGQYFDRFKSADAESRSFAEKLAAIEHELESIRSIANDQSQRAEVAEADKTTLETELAESQDRASYLYTRLKEARTSNRNQINQQTATIERERQRTGVAESNVARLSQQNERMQVELPRKQQALDLQTRRLQERPPPNLGINTSNVLPLTDRAPSTTSRTAPAPASSKPTNRHTSVVLEHQARSPALVLYRSGMKLKVYFLVQDDFNAIEAIYPEFSRFKIDWKKGYELEVHAIEQFKYLFPHTFHGTGF